MCLRTGKHSQTRIRGARSYQASSESLRCRCVPQISIEVFIIFCAQASQPPNQTGPPVDDALGPSKDYVENVRSTVNKFQEICY